LIISQSEMESGGRGEKRGGERREPKRPKRNEAERRYPQLTTDQKRKMPRITAAADQDRMKAGDCLDHQVKMDSKREKPNNGRIRADNTDRTART